MQNFKKIIFVFLIVGFLFVSGKSVKAIEFENWTFLGGQTKIGKMNFQFHSANFFRFGNDYFLNHTQLSLDFPSKKSISFGIGYKQEYVELTDRWRAEYRPMLDLYYNKSRGNLNFQDRSRWEFRFMDGDFINRYRNQLQFSYIKFNRFTPYFSTEFSLYINKLGYTRQRTLIGARIPVNHFNFNLFLGHQINEDCPEIWTNKMMLGTSLNYNF